MFICVLDLRHNNVRLVSSEQNRTTTWSEAQETLFKTAIQNGIQGSTGSWMCSKPMSRSASALLQLTSQAWLVTMSLFEAVETDTSSMRDYVLQSLETNSCMYDNFKWRHQLHIGQQEVNIHRNILPQPKSQQAHTESSSYSSCHLQRQDFNATCQFRHGQ